MSKTSIFLKLEGKLEPIRVSWYGSPSSEELNANILENVGLAPGTPFQLLDARGEPIIITPDLASDTTLQLQVARTSATPEEELLRLGTEEQREAYVPQYHGGDQNLLKDEKLIQNLQKFKGYKQGETIQFADIASKVNIKFKHQDRVLVITNEAVYNVDPSGFKVKRRIDLRAVDELSLSSLDDDYLVMHVPSEYDYLWITKRKAEMVQLIRNEVTKLTGRDVKMNVSNGFQYRVDKKTTYSIIFTKVSSGINVKIYS